MTTRAKIELLLCAVLGLLVLGLGTAALWQRDTYGERSQAGSERFEYDLDAYTAVPADKIGYHETGTLALPLAQPRAIAVGPDDRLYVAGDRRVVRFDAQGQPLPALTLTEEPTCLAVASAEHTVPGGVFVGLNRRIVRLDPQGAEAAAWTEGLNEDSVLTAIAPAEEDLFAADAGNRVVLHWDPTGKLLGRIGAPDPDRGVLGFVIPSPNFDAVVTADGLLRVVNPGARRIETYTFDGDRLGQWGQASSDLDGFFGCCNPARLAVLPGGQLVTSEKGLPRIKVYSEQGVFQCVVAAPQDLTDVATLADEPREEHAVKVFDVATDSRGRVLVLDPNTRRVRIFEKKPEARS